VASKHRRRGIGSTLLVEHERNLALHNLRSVRIETAIENAVAVAFWQRHGYRIEAVLKRYYLGRLDAYEMRKILPAATTAKPAQKEA
jgi:ribosomal protein S18 acetylase RimI-like enzyme